MPTALITGASSGIGKELANLFASDHNNVVLVARRKEKLEQLAYDLREVHGVSAHVIACDLGQPNAARELFDKTQELDLVIDYLVNNAGIGQYGSFAESDEAQLMTLLNLNICALTQLTRLYLPNMIARNKGRILNVGSTAGFQPGPHMAIYYASKAYVYSFTEALVEELRGTKITVTNLAPGATNTEFQSTAEMEKSMLFAAGAATAQSVAKAGYKGMMKGKSLVVPGLRNQLLRASIPFIPREVVRRAVGRLNQDV